MALYILTMNGTSMKHAIHMDDITKQFGEVTALNKLSLDINEGEIFGLLGPNGAGKSTAINILSGILQPTSGTATVAGYDILKNTNEIKHRIGVCPQQSAYYGYMTGRENIEFFGNLHGLNKQVIKERTTELIQKIGLEESADRKTSGYSGGMVRRVNLAMALINNPEIAFLDEPTVAMDPQSRRATWSFIEEFRSNGKTVILTTHYIEEAEALSDRVGIIDNGTLIALGNPNELIEEHEASNLEDVFIKLTGRRIREEI